MFPRNLYNMCLLISVCSLTLKLYPYNYLVLIPLNKVVTLTVQYSLVSEVSIDSIAVFDKHEGTL